MTVEERFWSKVDRGPEDECWLWTAYLRPDGYGQFWLDGRMQPAHRVAYELLVGPVPEGLELDHLCRVPACVNPAHMEPVTHTENCRRGEGGLVTGARSRAKTHCPRGHPLAADNLVPSSLERGGRECLTCKRDLARAYRVAHREERAAYNRAYRERQTA